MNVLFIEDDRMNRRVVRDMLDVAGASMTEAEDAERGLALIDAQDFQVVLIDLRMPGMDGITAIRHIRARGDARGQVPIIVGGTSIWQLVQVGPGSGAICAAATEPRERERPCPIDLHHHPIPDDPVE